jgi:hypothetical protein
VATSDQRTPYCSRISSARPLPVGGQATIRLDGRAMGTADESSRGSALRVPVLTRLFGAVGRHALTITVDAGSPSFAVDAVTYAPR